MGALGDCELIRSSLLGQPVNALTSVVFALIGVPLLWRHGLRWLGIGLVATGVGSFLFHGPMPAGSEWAHDVSLIWLIALAGALGTRWESRSRLPALLVIGVIVALVPVAADALAVALVVAAVGSIVLRSRSLREMAPLALLALAALLGRLGATGGPLCDPNSILQLHGIWHIGAALAVAWWGHMHLRLSYRAL